MKIEIHLHFKIKFRPRGLILEIGRRVYLFRWVQVGGAKKISFEKYG